VALKSSVDESRGRGPWSPLDSDLLPHAINSLEVLGMEPKALPPQGHQRGQNVAWYGQQNPGDPWNSPSSVQLAGRIKWESPWWTGPRELLPTENPTWIASQVHIQWALVDLFLPSQLTQQPLYHVSHCTITPVSQGIVQDRINSGKNICSRPHKRYLVWGPDCPCLKPTF
jgi:hypothetical protein